MVYLGQDVVLLLIPAFTILILITQIVTCCTQVTAYIFKEKASKVIYPLNLLLQATDIFFNLHAGLYHCPF